MATSAKLGSHSVALIEAEHSRAKPQFEPLPFWMALTPCVRKMLCWRLCHSRNGCDLRGPKRVEPHPCLLVFSPLGGSVLQLLLRYAGHVTVELHIVLQGCPRDWVVAVTQAHKAAENRTKIFSGGRELGTRRPVFTVRTHEAARPEVRARLRDRAAPGNPSGRGFSLMPRLEEINALRILVALRCGAICNHARPITLGRRKRHSFQTCRAQGRCRATSERPCAPEVDGAWTCDRCKTTGWLWDLHVLEGRQV